MQRLTSWRHPILRECRRAFVGLRGKPVTAFGAEEPDPVLVCDIRKPDFARHLLTGRTPKRTHDTTLDELQNRNLSFDRSRTPVAWLPGIP